jgi:hypothetical protein
MRKADGAAMRRDTWTRRAVRWICESCGHINPNTTSKCRICGD